MYQFAIENPTSTVATYVAHLPPRNFFTEAAPVSSPEGEPSQAGWDIFAIVVFMSIFMLGVVVGIACCLIAQWLYKLVEKLQRAHAAENSSGQFTVVIASPWEITLTPEGEYYHIDKNCWGTQKARSKNHMPPCSLCAKKVK